MLDLRVYCDRCGKLLSTLEAASLPLDLMVLGEHRHVAEGFGVRVFAAESGGSLGIWAATAVQDERGERAGGQVAESRIQKRGGQRGRRYPMLTYTDRLARLTGERRRPSRRG